MNTQHVTRIDRTTQHLKSLQVAQQAAAGPKNNSLNVSIAAFNRDLRHKNIIMTNQIDVNRQRTTTWHTISEVAHKHHLHKQKCRAFMALGFSAFETSHCSASQFVKHCATGTPLAALGFARISTNVGAGPITMHRRSLASAADIRGGM